MSVRQALPVPGRSKYGCRFPNCKNKYYSDITDPKYKNKHFYKFPSDPEKYKKWLEICGIPSENYNSGLRICEDHFQSTDFINYLKTKLNNGACPKFLRQLGTNEDLKSEGTLRNVGSEDGVASRGDLSVSVEDNISVKENDTFQISENDFSDSDDSVGSEDLYEPGYAYMTAKAIEKSGEFSEDEWMNDVISKDYDKFVASNNTRNTYVTSTNINRELIEFDFLLEEKYDRSQHDEIVETEEIHQFTIQKLSRLSSLLKNKAEHLEILLSLMRLGKFSLIKANLEVASDEKISSFLPNAPKLCTKRWSLNQKVLALSIYKESPLLYKYLYCFFHLPPKSSFDIILAKMPYNLGLNDNVLELLLTKRRKMQRQDSCCALLFEQILLKKSKLYYKHHNKLLGEGRKRPGITYCTIISVQGITRKWHMILAYYFTSLAKDYDKTKDLIHVIITQLLKLKYDVCALIINKNKANTPIINSLLGPVETPCFKVDDKTIYLIYNYPGFVYEFWKIFQDHNIEGPQCKLAKFEDVDKALDIDSESRFSMGKLIVENKRKMTPHRFAVEQMGYKISYLINNAVMRRLMDAKAMDTAELVYMIHRISNSFSGANMESSCEDRYNCVLSDKSQHLKLWKEAVMKMSMWRIKCRSSGNDMTDEFHLVDTWRQLFSCIVELWKELKKKGFRYLPVKNLTLNSLEHFILGLWEYNEPFS